MPVRAAKPWLILLGNASLLVIDEAQRVPNIGLNLKILVDSFPHAAIIATGSASSTWRTRSANRALGRALTYTLYPVSYAELRQAAAFEVRELDCWLIWGGYPTIITTHGLFVQRLLGELVGVDPHRDILEMDGLRRGPIEDAGVCWPFRSAKRYRFPNWQATG